MFFSKHALKILLVLVMGLDLLFTLTCQPDCYWDDYSTCVEVNPIGEVALSYHPNCFAGLFVCWIFIAVFLFAKFPRPLNIILVALTLLGHAWWGGSWLPKFCSRYTEISVDDLNARVNYFFFIVFMGLWLTWINYEPKSSSTSLPHK